MTSYFDYYARRPYARASAPESGNGEYLVVEGLANDADDLAELFRQAMQQKDGTNEN